MHPPPPPPIMQRAGATDRSIDRGWAEGRIRNVRPLQRARVNWLWPRSAAVRSAQARIAISDTGRTGGRTSTPTPTLPLPLCRPHPAARLIHVMRQRVTRARRQTAGTNQRAIGREKPERGRAQRRLRRSQRRQAEAAALPCPALRRTCHGDACPIWYPDPGGSLVDRPACPLLIPVKRYYHAPLSLTHCSCRSSSFFGFPLHFFLPRRERHRRRTRAARQLLKRATTTTTSRRQRQLSLWSGCAGSARQRAREIRAAARAFNPLGPPPRLLRPPISTQLGAASRGSFRARAARRWRRER